MSDAEVLDQARQRFRRHVLAEEETLSGARPDADEANAHVDATDALVRQWAADGTAPTVLHPLLADEHPAVRAPRPVTCSTTVPQRTRKPLWSP